MLNLKKIEIPVCSSLDAFNIANMDQNKMTHTQVVSNFFIHIHLLGLMLLDTHYCYHFRRIVIIMPFPHHLHIYIYIFTNDFSFFIPPVITMTNIRQIIHTHTFSSHSLLYIYIISNQRSHPHPNERSYDDWDPYSIILYCVILKMY